MEEGKRWAIVTQIVWMLAGLLVIAAAVMFIVGRIRGPKQVADVIFPSSYQAVLLSNGSVYFGKLEGYGGPRPVLNEVYYILTQTNTETKQSTNILVKRGKELHQPDRMYLNPSQIIFVEPVGPDSKVASLIQESKSGKQ
jgi:hypothetical protein